MGQIISKYRGDDWQFPMTIKMETDGVLSVFDLTAATLTSTVANGGTVVWTGTPSVVSAVAGTILVTVPKASTVGLAPGVYDADVQVDKAGVRSTAVEWKIQVCADITRP
jgi:hypothetical protein